jgi:hypothetical protein
MPILRGSLVGPTRFRSLERLNEISTHLTVSCLGTSAARCNSATRAWMSSHWMASGPQARVASAARIRVDAGLFGSTMTLPMVAAARDICCNRDRLPKTSPARFPRSPLALWRQGPEGGFGQSASNMPNRPACSAQRHRGPGSPKSRAARRESAVLDEGGDLVGHADIGLVDDPELALEAGAFNNAVELVALLPSNGRSIQGNTCRR